MLNKELANFKKNLIMNNKLKEEDLSINISLPLIIGGPCSIESEEMIEKVAKNLHNLGIKYIRGGAFKPRTSPYEFQGLKKEGIAILRKIANKYNLKIVCEITDIRDLDLFINNVDIIQVGTRNMYNYPLLEELGKTNKYILLKRGLSATLKEWLLASEYILKEGNKNIIFCERGIRTYCDHSRNTLDLSIIPIMKEFTKLPIIVDPSHACGNRSLITPLSKAALAVGSDGLIIETHPNPNLAYSDGEQSLSLEEFNNLIIELKIFQEEL